MKSNDMTGIFAILVTPLTSRGGIDEGGLRHLVDHCCKSKFSGVVALGSNGEFPYLNHQEKRKVMKIAADQAAGRLKVIAGVSDYGTDQAISLARYAKKAGCDAVIAAVPTYFRLGIEQVLSHLASIHEKGGLPVVFYYYPETTRLILTTDDIARIAALKGVIGAKITALSVPFLEEVIKKTSRLKFSVTVGSSYLLKECLDLGGTGVCCPLPLLGGTDIKSILRFHQSGNRKKSRKMQDKVIGSLPIYAGTYLEPKDAVEIMGQSVQLPMPEISGTAGETHSLIKEGLRLQGHPITGFVKKPHRPVNAEQSQMIRKTLKSIGWL